MTKEKIDLLNRKGFTAKLINKQIIFLLEGEQIKWGDLLEGVESIIGDRILFMDDTGLGPCTKYSSRLEGWIFEDAEGEGLEFDDEQHAFKWYFKERWKSNPERANRKEIQFNFADPNP
jgi:hypothetical protein